MNNDYCSKVEVRVFLGTLCCMMMLMILLDTRITETNRFAFYSWFLRVAAFLRSVLLYSTAEEVSSSHYSSCSLTQRECVPVIDQVI